MSPISQSHNMQFQHGDIDGCSNGRFENDQHDQGHADEDGNNEDSRVILHFDLDAFYVACERELNSQLRGVPVAVSQYNPYGTLQERSSKDIHGRWVVQPVVSIQDQESANINTSSDNKSESDNSQLNVDQKEDTNGSLIAVSYEARASGVKRNQRGREACQKCKGLNIVQVPVKHGKADLTMYRTASKRVMEALRKAVEDLGSSITEKEGTTKSLLEVASIDEVYIDVTALANQLAQQVVMEWKTSKNQMLNDDTSLWKSILENAATCTTIGGVEVLSRAAQATNALDKDELRRGSHVQVLDSNGPNKVDPGSKAWWERHPSLFSTVQLRLVCGAYIAATARSAVLSSFDGGVFTLSAGISCNKTLAKLASGLKKPNRQTLIYRDPKVLQKLFHPLPLGRIRGLGGKFGDSISQRLGIETVGQLAEIPLLQLQQTLSNQQSGEQSSSKTAQFLYDISRGLCNDPVTPRNKPKSIECSKTFRGPLSIPAMDTGKLEKWVGELCSELQERMQQDNDEHNRFASTMRVAVQFHNQKSFHSKQNRAPRSLELYPKVSLSMIQQLIEATQKKRSSNGNDMKNLKITAIAIGGSQFVDIAEGSSSILSAMQKSPKATPSTGTSPGKSAVASPKRFIAEKKRSAMDEWLQGSTPKRGTIALGARVTASPESKRAKQAETVKGKSPLFAIRPQTTDASRGSVTSTALSSNSASSASVLVPNSMEDIDDEVFKALPKEVQEAVIGDMRYQQRQKQTQKLGKEKEKRGIQGFFKPYKAKAK